MERREKIKIALFAFSGLAFGLLVVSKLFLADKIAWLSDGKWTTLQGNSIAANACTLETADNGKTFFISCSGFLE
jgi:hypothetical protein